MHPLRLLDMNTYLTIFNGGGNNFHTAEYNGSFYYGLTEHALQNE